MASILETVNVFRFLCPCRGSSLSGHRGEAVDINGTALERSVADQVMGAAWPNASMRVSSVYHSRKFKASEQRRRHGFVTLSAFSCGECSGQQVALSD